jgi:predicted transcriptional regulator
MTKSSLRERCIVSAEVPPQVRERLERLAAAADRSLSAEVRRALSEHLVRESERRP